MITMLVASLPGCRLQDPTLQQDGKHIAKAFPMAPFLNLPKLNGPKLLRVYELRSYESYTEKIHANKVQMFNEGGEIDLFKQLNFNAVFYGSVVSGSRMPNLMYMTTFENKADVIPIGKHLVNRRYGKNLKPCRNTKTMYQKMNRFSCTQRFYSDY
jgi:hypothetical protein